MFYDVAKFLDIPSNDKTSFEFRALYDISRTQVLHKFLYYYYSLFEEHPILFLTANISGLNETRSSRISITKSRIRRIRNGARYHVKTRRVRKRKKSLAYRRIMSARIVPVPRQRETRGREKREGRLRSSRHTLFMSSRVPLTMWVYEIKMHCLCKCRSRIRSAVSVGVNSQSASGNNHNDQ